MDFLRTIILEIKINWFLFTGDYTSAIPHLSEVLLIRKMRFGKDSIKIVPTILLLAHCFHRSGDKTQFTGAIFIYMEANEIAQKSAGKEKNLLMGKIAMGMGQWFADSNNSELAEQSFQKAIEAFTLSESSDALLLLESLYGRITALRQLGRKDEAEHLEKWAAQIEATQRYMDQYEYHGHYPRP